MNHQSFIRYLLTRMSLRLLEEVKYNSDPDYEKENGYTIVNF
jgi:hypothetical protein